MATLKTQCDIELDSGRLEVLRLKNQLRALCEQRSLAVLYSAFESNIARLLKENETLRRVNLELESKEFDKTNANIFRKKDNGKIDGNTQETSYSYLLDVANKENNRLLLKLKKSGQDREALRESYEALKMKERQFTLSGKLAQDSGRRLRTAHQVQFIA